MFFTHSEMIALNSVLDGSGVWGIKIDTPEEKDEKYYNDAIERLREKGMVDKAGEPTKLFAAAAKMLESYKTAKHHLFINQVRVGLDGDWVTAIVPAEGGFEVLRVYKVIFLGSSILANSSLSAKDTSTLHKSIIEHDDWIKNTLPKLSQNILMLKKYDEKKLVDLLIMYQIGDRDYIYYPETQQCVQCGAQLKRIELLRLLEIEAPKEA